MYRLRLWTTLLSLLLVGPLLAGPECAIFKNHPYQVGRAEIAGLAEGSAIRGVVHFEESEDGLHIYAELSGMPPGKHGFHIHEFGAVTQGGKDAGGHYNPFGKPHGYVVSQGVQNVHAGDLGNIEIAEDGTGILDLRVKDLWLTGHQINVAGRAVIVHEKEDDFGQPVGNAGARIAGGAIILVDRS